MANNQLSWRREEVVRRYLTDNAALLNRISFIGLGEEKADGRARRTPKTATSRSRSTVPRTSPAGSARFGFEQLDQGVQRAVRRRRDAERLAPAHHVAVEVVDLGGLAAREVLRGG